MLHDYLYNINIYIYYYFAFYVCRYFIVFVKSISTLLWITPSYGGVHNAYASLLLDDPNPPG